MNKLVQNLFYGIILLTILTSVYGMEVHGQEISDKTVVIVNGQKLKQYHFMNVMSKILPMAPSHGGLTPEVIEKNTNKAIRKMVEDELFYQEGVRQGLKPDRQQVKNEIKAFISKVGGKEKLDELLKNVGLSKADLEKMAAKPQMVLKLMDREVNSKAVISADEAMEYYEKNKSTHFVIERRRMRLIYFKIDPGSPESWVVAKKKADDVLEKVKGGADFAEMARKYSDGPRRKHGGDTGLIDRTQMPGSFKAVRDVAWAMEAGDVSEPIGTIFGLYLVSLVEKPANEVYSFEEIRGQVELTLKMLKKDSLRAGLLNRLKADADIKVLLGEYK